MTYILTMDEDRSKQYSGLAMGFGANSYVIVLSYKYIVSHSQTFLMHAKAQRVIVIIIVIVIFFHGVHS